MGSGSWSTKAFASYSTALGRSVSSSGAVIDSLSNQEIFLSKSIDPALNPNGVIRECVDSDEHPETIPVILALDVTGSMGDTAVEIAKQLNVIMTNLYESVKDVEFMIMGIGDLAFDHAPIQASQFESDIRIADQLEKVYFEFGGGGNSFESYTAAWYFGNYCTKLDCWKRNKRGIIITIGDERLNPYLPKEPLRRSLGIIPGQEVLETKFLFPLVNEKFHVYHLNVDHRGGYDKVGITESFKEYENAGLHFKTVNLDDVPAEITNIIKSVADETPTVQPVVESKVEHDENGSIIW